MPDFALIVDGAVAGVCKHPGPAAFGDRPGEVVEFDPAEGVRTGMVWNGVALSEPEPPPAPYVRRLLPKSVVQERAHALGKLAPIMAILRSEGQEINYARWFASDWPRVYFDDPAMLALLQAVGCTEAQIAEITAP